MSEEEEMPRFQIDRVGNMKKKTSSIVRNREVAGKFFQRAGATSP